MSRRVLVRLAMGVLLAPLAALVSLECGGSDVVDALDGSPDATADRGETSSEAMSDVGSDSTDGTPEAAMGSVDVETAGETTVGESGGTESGGEAAGAESGSEAAGTESGGAESGGEAAGTESGGTESGSEAGGVDAGGADATVEGGTLAAPALGTARTFAILAGSTITNTGTATAIFGDVGISPGTALVGLTAGQVNGTLHLGDPAAMKAEADLTTAYNDLAGRPCQHTMTDVDLGGKTLPPGVYCFAVAAAQAVGDLMLDGQGDPNAIWIFQIASTLTISANLSTTMIGGGNACNVYWQVGSSATINGGAQLKGNVFAQASISLLNGAHVSPGRTLAQTAAVTMQSTNISNAGCP